MTGIGGGISVCINIIDFVVSRLLFDSQMQNAIADNDILVEIILKFVAMVSLPPIGTGQPGIAVE